MESARIYLGGEKRCLFFLPWPLPHSYVAGVPDNLSGEEIYRVPIDDGHYHPVPITHRTTAPSTLWTHYGNQAATRYVTYELLKSSSGTE